MASSGMKPKDLMELDASKNKDELVAFVNSVFSAGQMDQLQTPYYSDYILHSVMPVPEVIAKANLKPVPGAIVYVDGSQDCFYRKHTLYVPETDKTVEQYYRCVCHACVCAFGCELLLNWPQLAGTIWP